MKHIHKIPLNNNMPRVTHNKSSISLDFICAESSYFNVYSYTVLLLYIHAFRECMFVCIMLDEIVTTIKKAPRKNIEVKVYIIILSSSIFYSFHINNNLVYFRW